MADHGTFPSKARHAREPSLAMRFVAQLNKPEFLILWFVPFLTMLSLTLFYTNHFMMLPSICVLASAACVAVCFMLGIARKVPIGPTLAVALLVATVAGTALGLYTYDQYTIYPMFYNNARIYTNIVPSQSNDAVADAGKIVFTATSMVDVNNSVGYITESGYTYCVAPVRDGSGTSRVEYWAVGLGCCSSLGGFSCDDAADPEAHAGIVIFDNTGIFGDSWKDDYDKARLKAIATFSLTSDATPMYVRWVREDNMDMVANYYSWKATLFLLFFFTLYFGLSGALAYVLYKPKEALQP